MDSHAEDPYYIFYTLCFSCMRERLIQKRPPGGGKERSRAALLTQDCSEVLISAPFLRPLCNSNESVKCVRSQKGSKTEEDRVKGSRSDWISTDFTLSNADRQYTESSSVYPASLAQNEIPKETESEEKERRYPGEREEKSECWSCGGGDVSINRRDDSASVVR